MEPPCSIDDISHDALGREEDDRLAISALFDELDPTGTGSVDAAQLDSVLAVYAGEHPELAGALRAAAAGRVPFGRAEFDELARQVFRANGLQCFITRSKFPSWLHEINARRVDSIRLFPEMVI